MTNPTKPDILLEEAAERFEDALSELEEPEQIEALRGVIGVLNYSAAQWYLRAQLYKALHGVSFLLGFILAWYFL